MLQDDPQEPHEDEDHEEYEQLRGRLEDLREELSETLGGIEDDEDFISTLRNIDDN